MSTYIDVSGVKDLCSEFKAAGAEFQQDLKRQPWVSATGYSDVAGKNSEFPGAVPEIPVADMAKSLTYYEECLGFSVDWGRDGGGIAGISQGRSRIFLTDRTIREYFHNEAPVVIWLNLDSKDEVDALHEKWKGNGAKIKHPPESKPWSRLHEFVAMDLDGNLIRAFYNY